jgi:hypothetical protein
MRRKEESYVSKKGIGILTEGVILLRRILHGDHAHGCNRLLAYYGTNTTRQVANCVCRH